MKAKVKENLKNLSADEMRSELRQSREKLFNLKFKHKITPVANPLEIRTVRRKIAMLETFLKVKQGAASARTK